MSDRGCPPDLKAQRALIYHNYDLMLERQARLYTTASSKCVFLSDDIMQRQNVLLLDDLAIFAMSARRVIDICGLQSKSYELKILELTLDWSYDPVKTCSKKDSAIGFYNLINRIIHMSNIRYFDNRVVMHISFGGARLSKNKFGDVFIDPEHCINGIFLITEAKRQPIMIGLNDLVERSVEANELIIARCDAMRRISI